MPHIQLTDGVPGIRSAFQFSPETARPMLALAEVLLRGESTLSRAEREMIAARVSGLNGCHFCQASHRAAAAHHLGGDYTVVDAVLAAPATAPISPKFRALLDIAALVVAGGLKVSEADVAAARHEGATDRELHDTVLIAAAFCMYNRYVDGLATWSPHDEALYDEMGRRLAHIGYAARPPDRVEAGS
jgi:uncharacterized peroxidase-related enzyme